MESTSNHFYSQVKIPSDTFINWHISRRTAANQNFIYIYFRWIYILDLKNITIFAWLLITMHRLHLQVYTIPLVSELFLILNSVHYMKKNKIENAKKRAIFTCVLSVFSTALKPRAYYWKFLTHMRRAEV